MQAHLDRALILLEQNRHDLAEQELRHALAADPGNPMAHSLLALCLAQREQYNDATAEAELAIHQAPDVSFVHYVLAKVLLDRNRPDEAARAIDEAIRLDPEDAHYFAVLSSIRFSQRRWAAALEAAEQGLRHDAEHVGCTNLRAMALVKLGRKAEAGATIDAALARDPENALTHANQGWALLEQSQHAAALDHFREALRLDPELEWARRGIVEALKARHLVYRVLLRFFLWMSKLSPTAQWGVIVGGFVGRRMLQRAADTYPVLAPWIMPLLILYIAFALMTWVADPLFNLLLRLDRFGRLALSRKQVVASNWIGSLVLVALLALGLWLVTRNGYALFGAMGLGALIMPLAGTFNCPAGWPRTSMAVFTAALAAVGLIALALLMVAPAQPIGPVDLGSIGVSCGMVFLVGAILSPWLANGLMMARPKR